MTRTHIYSRAAAADLREITKYTVKQWGTAQARTYAQQIEDAAVDLATENGASKDLGAIHPGLKVKRAGHHYVFCVLRSDRPALILAILHERMDLLVRLGSRLNA